MHTSAAAHHAARQGWLDPSQGHAVVLALLLLLVVVIPAALALARAKESVERLTSSWD